MPTKLIILQSSCTVQGIGFRVYSCRGIAHTEYYIPAVHGIALSLFSKSGSDSKLQLAYGVSQYAIVKCA